MKVILQVKQDLTDDSTLRFGRIRQKLNIDLMYCVLAGRNTSKWCHMEACTSVWKMQCITWFHLQQLGISKFCNRRD
jgi:hypothetical protein